MRKVFLLTMLVMLTANVSAQKFVGGDISVLLKYEAQNATYLDKDGQKISDVLTFLKEQGWNTMRVRLFVDPSKETDKNVCQDLEYVKRLDKRIKDAGLKYYQYTDLKDVIPTADIIYMTRVQRERFPDPMEYERVKDSCILTADMLRGCKDTMRILHPLPRVNEITTDVDANPKAYYVQQAQNGVYARQALIAAILGLK